MVRCITNLWKHILYQDKIYLCFKVHSRVCYGLDIACCIYVPMPITLIYIGSLILIRILRSQNILSWTQNHGMIMKCLTIACRTKFYQKMEQWLSLFCSSENISEWAFENVKNNNGVVIETILKSTKTVSADPFFGGDLLQNPILSASDCFLWNDSVSFNYLTYNCIYCLNQLRKGRYRTEIANMCC